MKLTHVALTRFRSAVDIDLPLDASRILIAGVNGVGKTNVREAVRWALTGHCDYTDGKGAGAEVLIPEGEKVAEVTVTIDGIGSLCRTFSEKGGGTMAVSGWTGTGQIQQQALYGRLQTIPQYVDACLDSEAFLRLGHAEAKAMVLGLLQVSIPVGDKTYTLDQLDQAYKVAFADRTVAKRNLQAFFMAPAPGPQTTPAIAAIEAQLAKLRTTLGEHQKAVGATAGQRQVLQASMEARAFQHPEGDLSADIAKLEAKLAELEAEIVPKLPGKNDPMRLPVLRSVEAAIAAHDPRRGCVIDGTVPCMTDPQYFGDRLNAVRAEVGALASWEEEPTDSPLTTVRKQLGELVKRQRARETTLKAIEKEEQRIAGVKAALDALPETAQQEADLAGVEARINKGRALLAEAQQYAQKLAEYDASLKRKDALAADVTRVEALVEELGPKGARVKALGEAMDRFQSAVNPFVDPYGWKIRFSVEPWEVYANDRPVSTYSRSEQYRIGIALQIGIAMLSGLKFAIIDELDMLDVSNRGLATAMILKSPLEQVIVLGTREVGQALPQVKGVKAIRLGKRDGRTYVQETMLPRAAEAVTA